MLVTGVQARPELNGRIGTARAFDVTKGRVPVILDDSGGDGILLRRSNLVSAADDFESTFEIGQEGGGREAGGREVGGGEAGASGALTPPPVPPTSIPSLPTVELLQQCTPPPRTRASRGRTGLFSVLFLALTHFPYMPHPILPIYHNHLF